MIPLLNPRRTRFTAVVMLFVWLVTLAAGVVNACQLHEDHVAGAGALAHGKQASAGSVGVRAVAPSVAASVTQQDDDDQMAESIACQALCATVQAAVPKPQPLAFAVHAAEPVLVASSGPFHVLPNPVSAAPAVVRVPRPEPPVYLRFLRLTL